MLSKWKKLLIIPVLALAASPALAHGVWLGVRCDADCLVLGDGPKDNAYDPAMVTGAKAYTTDHKETEITVIPKNDHVEFKLDDSVAIVAVNFDYGYWSRNAEGKFVNKPMTEVPGSDLGTHAVKFNVSYLKPEAKPMLVEGLDMQFVPSVNPASLNMGDAFEVQLLHNGKPMANTPVIIDVINDLNGTVLTDADGKATITVRNNALNVVGVEVAVPEQNNDKCTQTKYFASLSFTCHPEYD